MVIIKIVHAPAHAYITKAAQLNKYYNTARWMQDTFEIV